MSDTIRIDVYDQNGTRLGKATLSWEENGQTRMFIDNSPVRGGMTRMNNGFLVIHGNYFDAQGNAHNPVCIKESDWSRAQQPEDKENM